MALHSLQAFETLEIRRQDNVVWVWLARPDRLNAQTPRMWQELAEVGEQLCADDSVRAVVVSGRGRSFSSGIDLRDLVGTLRQAESDAERRRIGQLAQGATTWLARAPFPTLAAVRGYAYGAGLALALGADLRIATADARFGAVEAKYGIVPDMGVVEWLPRLVGMGRAKEMIFLAQPVDAVEAHRIGIVNRLVPTGDDLETAAAQLAAGLAAGPPLALRHSKRLVQQAFDPDGVAIAASLEAQFECLASADFEEACNAFLEGRPPVFAGR